MASCNTIYIDIDGQMKAIQNECFVMLNAVADKVVEEFGKAIIGGGAGRTKWRENAAKEFKVLSDSISADMIEVKVGLREGLESEARSSFYAAQIMVAQFGNHGLQYTKPGEMTFHDHMESIDESHAKSVWALPSGYNWADPHPEKMLENIFKMTRQIFMDGLHVAFNAVRFSDYVQVA